MCMFSKPKAPPAVQVPAAPVAPPAPQQAPQAQDKAVQESRVAERQRKMKAAAANNTMVTGGQGLAAPAQTAGKQLFGQ